MATKFYLHDATTTNTGTLPSGENSSLTSNGSATPPATNTTQRSMDTYIGTSQASLAGTTQATTSAQAMLMGMWESAPLAAQTLPTGTWTLSFAQKEANANANFQVTFCLYVWRPSTGAMVGSAIYDHSANAAEGGTSENAVTLTTGSLTGVAVSNGDILVCEIWRASIAQGTATARVCTFYYDGTTEASATNCASFLECNGGDISFQGAKVAGVGASVAVAGGIGSVNATSAEHFTAVGSIVQTDVSTVTLSPSSVGNFFLFEVITESSSVWASGISGGNCDWEQIGVKYLGSTSGIDYYVTLWQGITNSTGSATATITFSGSTPTVRAAGHEFSCDAGSWQVDGSQGNTDSGSGSAYASLTPSAAGDLYFGYAFWNGSISNGSTSGYVYQQDAHSNGLVYNTYCDSGAQAPAWGASAPILGISVLLEAAASSDASVTGVGAAVDVAGGVGSVKASAKITGVGAAVVVAGGIGSLTTTDSAAVTGIGAPVTVQGGIGSVTTTVSGIIAGQPAVVTVNGGVGSVTATQNQAITGVGAPVVVAGGVGSTSITANQSITGVGAAITVAGGVGVASSGVAGIVTGVGASIAVAGGIGSVTSNASITGVGTVVVVAGGIGSLTTTDSAAITGVAAEIVVAGGVGVASSGVSGIVTGVGASVAVNGGVGSLVTSAVIAGVGASISVAGGIGSVLATDNAAITGVGAAIVVAGGIGSTSSGMSVAVTGVGAAIVVAGGVGSLVTSAVITGVGASVSVDGGIGSANTGGSGTVIGVAAVVTVSGGIGSVNEGGPRHPAALGGTLTPRVYSGTVTMIDPGLTGTATITSYSGTVTQITYTGDIEGWTMQIANITLLEHNDETIDVVIKKNGSNLDITDYTIEAYLKTSSSVADDDASTIELSTSTGEITITDAANGAAEIAVPATDLSDTTSTFWRLDIILSGKRNTVFSGTVTVTPL